MKIDLTKIPSGGRRINLSYERDWWRSDFDDDRIVGLERPLNARLTVYPAGKKIAIDGVLSTGLLLRCDRCLETFTKEVSTDFHIYVSVVPYEGEAEVELLENDLNLDFMVDNFVDIDQVIKEQLILNLPMKTLCSDDCKGLCPACGCNLNEENCSCHVAYGTSGRIN